MVSGGIGLGWIGLDSGVGECATYIPGGFVPRGLLRRLLGRGCSIDNQLLPF